MLRQAQKGEISVPDEKIKELKERAKELRKTAVTMIYEAQSGHPGGSLSAADIVAALYFSEMHRATGRTFKDLLLEKRLSKAAQLLRETRLTTQDIILAVGYENTSYFYRVFRDRFGVTPRDYRKERGGDFLPQTT